MEFLGSRVRERGVVCGKGSRGHDARVRVGDQDER